MNKQIKPIIRDLTESKEPKKLEPIQLLGCLQSRSNKDGNYHFFKGDFRFSLKIAKQITRVIRAGDVYSFDVIQVDGTLYYGYWNDGVVE